MSRAVTTLAASLALLIAAPLLSGCGGEARQEAEQSSVEPATDEAVVLTSGWAKSAETGDMTGVFGTLENRSDRELVIEQGAMDAVESEVAEASEFHEVTTAGVMQPISSEIRIPAGGSFELAPGANHIMLMGLREQLLAGDDVRFTVRFSDGTEAVLIVPVKDYAGANESYHGGSDDDSDHTDDEHGAH